MLQTAHGGCLIDTREAGKIEINGNPVRVSWHRSLPLPVFICPRCDHDCYRIYDAHGYWACRKCHRLDYASRHRHRTIPGFNRLIYLRRRIGAGLPFSPILAPTRWTANRLAIVAEIRRPESGLIGHAGAVGRRKRWQVIEMKYLGAP
jgi:hypothetical protein